MAIGVNVHVLRADYAEDLEAAPKFAHSRAPDRVERTCNRKVEGSVPHDAHFATLQLIAYRVRVYLPGRRSRGFDGQIEEIEAEVSHPANFVQNVIRGMVHRANDHRLSLMP